MKRFNIVGQQSWDRGCIVSSFAVLSRVPSRVVIKSPASRLFCSELFLLHTIHTSTHVSTPHKSRARETAEEESGGGRT